MPADKATAGASSTEPDLRRAIERFLKANKIDEIAASSLRASPANVQKFVISRGDLSGARNPSSALLKRLKDARVSATEIGSGATTEAIARAAAFASSAQHAAATETLVSNAAAVVENGYDVAALYKALYPELYGYNASGLVGRTGELVAQASSGSGGASSILSHVVEVAGATSVGYSSFVKMRGLPYSASKEDVLHFFKSFKLSAQDITLGRNSDGRSSGDAVVRFSSEKVAQEAITAKNKQLMSHRYVDLFLVSKKEAIRTGLTDMATGAGYGSITIQGSGSRASPY